MLSMPEVNPVSGILSVEPLRLLIVADAQEEAQRLVCAIERAAYCVTWERVSTEDAYRAALSTSPDLILFDHELAAFDACRALHILEGARPDIPFILVAGALDEGAAFELTRCGMDDFLQKDRLTRLGLAVARTLRDRDERRRRRRMEIEQAELVRDLRERVKELRALHGVARLLAEDVIDESERFRRITELLPPALQYPELAVARLTVGERAWRSQGFQETEWKLVQTFSLPGNATGSIEVAYRRRPMPQAGDAFLEEERALLATLAEMIEEWIEREHGRREMARAAQMLASVRDAIIVTDAAGVVTYWNEQATRLFGWTAAEMIGRPLESRYSEPRMRGETRESVRNLLGGVEWFGEFEDRRKDGSGIWIDAHETPIVDDSGAITGIISISRDISARKRNEAELEQAQARLQALVSELEAERFRLAQAQAVAQIGQWILSADRSEVSWSEENFRIFELDPASFAPTLESVMALVHPEDAEALENMAQQALEDGRTHSLVHRILIGGGRVKIVEASMRAIRNELGQATQIIGTCRDITAAKEAEELLRATNEELESRVAERTRELAEREALISATLDALSAHIALLDPEGRIVATNRAWRTFANDNGAAWREVSEGMNYLSVCDTSARGGCSQAGEVAEVLSEILAGSLSEWSFEYPCPSPEEGRWFLLRARPLEIKGRIHALLAHENVSQMKRTQEELRSTAKLAEAANRAKSGFLMTMSHELRTPLNGVLGMNELLLTTQLDERQREYVDASTASGRHLLQLINDVLDLSRIEAGKMELLPVTCRLAPLVREVVASFAPLAQEQSLELQCELADGLPETIRCDRARLQQLLVNLVGNALKFTPAGRIGVRVGFADPTGDRARLRFEVSDTGIGIPADRHDRLFKTFSQVDDSTSRRYGGSGLGLSICRELVELMNGDIGVRSRVGEGSTFWFEIPIEPEAPAGVETPVPDGVDAAPMPSPVIARPGSLGHVLVAEDNHINQVYICEALRKLGYSTDVAASGHEVLQALDERQYDVVLMDCQMPEMDGFEAARAVRRREGDGDRRQPIVAVTANASPGDRDRCLEAGMDDYISKPVTLAQLQAVLAQFVGAGRTDT